MRNRRRTKALGSRASLLTHDSTQCSGARRPLFRSRKLLQLSVVLLRCSELAETHAAHIGSVLASITTAAAYDAAAEVGRP